MSLRLKNITSFFIEHPDLFITFISTYHGFTLRQLAAFKDYINWHQVSSNPNINWNAEILSAFKDKLDWKTLSTNPSVFKDLSLIDEFSSFIHWKDTEDTLFSTIASNEGINWTIDLIYKYEAYWDYSKLSYNETIPWSEDLINRFVDKWDWVGMSENCKLPWSVSFIEKHFKRLNKDSFWFSTNEGLTGNVEIIERYHKHLDWHSICRNSKLPWFDLNLLNRWQDHINWNGIAGNELLLSNTIFFETHLDKWLKHNGEAFRSLSSNRKLPWSIEFVNRFYEYWDCENLSMNPSLPWSIEFIDLFAEILYWGGISKEIEIDETGKTLIHHTYNNGLIDNEGLPWSIDFINYYNKQIDFNMLSYNSVVWDKAFKLYIDEDLINTILRII